MDDLVHVERPSSSLSASWATLSNADVLSNSSSALEDETQSQSTDAVSLLDQNTPDDANSLAEGSGSSQEEEDMYDDHSELSELSRGQYLKHNEAEQGQDSEMTARPPGIEAIEFEEPQSWPDAEMVDLKHTVRVFDDPETSSLGQKLCPGVPVEQVFGTLLGTTRMTMSRQTLDRDKPLRIIYAGDSWGRRKILEKLGEALLSSRPNSNTDCEKADRYSVISAPPNGSFSESVPLDTQIIVHDCLASAAAEETPGSKSITLSFRNITLFTSRSDGLTQDGKQQYVISSRSTWVTPDLAILFISNRDNSSDVKDFYQNVHAFMQRHDIPCMKIVEDDPWDLENDFSPIDRATLHLCIESRTRSAIEAKVLKRLPVDLDTYESIEPSQLNKNLTCLRSIAAVPSRSPHNAIERKPEPAEDFNSSHGNDWLRCSVLELLERSPFAGSPHANWLLHHPVIGFGLLVCCASLLGIASYMAIQLPVLLVTTLTSSLVNKAELAPATSVQNISIVPLITPTSTSSLRPSITQSTREVSLQGDFPKGLSEIQQQLDLAQILADPVVHSTNRSEKLQVHIVGDCHLIVKLPHRWLQRRKLNSFEVTIERGEQIINSTTMKLFDGVYTVKVALEEAHGPLNVTVSSAKPWVSETFEVDFGASWLKPAGWKKAAQVVSEQVRKDLNSAQSSIQVVYNRISKEAYSAIRDASKEAGKKSNELHGQCRTLLTQGSNQLSKLLSNAEKAIEARQITGSTLLEKFQTTRQGFTVQARSSRKIANLFIKDVSRTVVRTARTVQISTSRLEMSAIRQRLNNFKKFKFLATAQSRVQKALKEKNVRADEDSWRTSKKNRGRKCGGSCKMTHR